MKQGKIATSVANTISFKSVEITCTCHAVGRKRGSALTPLHCDLSCH